MWKVYKYVGRFIQNSIHHFPFNQLIMDKTHFKILFSAIMTVVSFGNLFAQKLDLSNRKALTEYLDGRQYQISDYGTVRFNYQEYDKILRSIKFVADYNINKGKKTEKHKCEVSLFYYPDPYNIPDGVIFLDIRPKNHLEVEQGFDFPTKFMITNKGELYYMERININSEEYINHIINGTMPARGRTYKLCKHLPN